MNEIIKHMLNSDKFEPMDILPVLKPLSKPHYSYGVVQTLLDDDALMYQMIRISRTVNIYGYHQSYIDSISKHIEMCKQINSSQYGIPCTIGITYRAWVEAEDAGYDLTEPPIKGSEAWNYEIGLFEDRINAIKASIDAANTEHNCDIRIGNINFETERWRTLQADGSYSDEEYQQRMTDCYDIFVTTTKTLLPFTDIAWYGRGLIYWGKGFNMLMHPHWTGNEITDFLSPYFYEVGCVDETRYLLNQNHKMAIERGIGIIPYIALGCGYARQTGINASWDWLWDYNLDYSYEIGKRVANIDRIKSVVLYPQMLDYRVESWAKHFTAYVLGNLE